MSALPLLLAVATSTQATAPEAPPTLIGHVIAGGTLNPRAGAIFLGVRYHDVYGKSDKPLFNNLYFDAGFELIASASLRPALFVEWSPLAILKLRVQYEFWGWTGAHLGLGHGLTFDGPRAAFDGDTLLARRGEEDPNIGHRLLFMPTLQIKIWRIVALNELELSAWYVHNGNPGEYWYASTADNLIKKGSIDGAIRNRLIVGAVVWDGDKDAQAIVATVYDYDRTLSAAIRRHRIGGLLQLTPYHELWGMLRPTLILLAGGNLRDRNREAEAFLLGAIKFEVGLL